MRTRTSILVLCLLLLIGGCRTTVDMELIPEASLPQDIYGSPEPSPSRTTQRELVLYFSRNSSLVSVHRISTSSAPPLEATLTSLLQGPTPEEMAAGISSEIPRSVQLIDSRLSGDTAIVDLSGEFETGAEQQVLMLRLGQVVFSATSLPGVSQVRILIDGMRRDVLIGDGSLVSRPITRADYSGLRA